LKVASRRISVNNCSGYVPSVTGFSYRVLFGRIMVE
jgi:hypothetical protein